MKKGSEWASVEGNRKVGKQEKGEEWAIAFSKCNLENAFIFFVQHFLLITISVGKCLEAVILSWYLIKTQFYFNNMVNTSQFCM